MTEREVIIRHVAACAVCGWLSRFAIRRRDPLLLDAALRLRDTHAENDIEREAFTRSSATAHATAQARSSSMRMAILGGDDDA